MANRIDDQEVVRETRAKKYTKLAGTLHVVENLSFRPIPVENLENVHKLRFTRSRPNLNASDRIIELTKSPLRRAHGTIPMPACKVQMVKKETRELTSGEQATLTRLGADVNPVHANMIRAYGRARPTKSLPLELFKKFDLRLQNLCSEIEREAQTSAGSSNEKNKRPRARTSTSSANVAVSASSRVTKNTMRNATASSSNMRIDLPANSTHSKGSRATKKTMRNATASSSNMHIDLPANTIHSKGSRATKKTMRNASASSSNAHFELSANQNMAPNIISSTLRLNNTPMLRAPLFDSAGLSTISSVEDFSSITKYVKSVPSAAPSIRRDPKPHSTF